MKIRRTKPTEPAFVKRADHARLWRMVEGAVADVFNSHTDYFTERGRLNAARSITKRVVGQIVGGAKGTLRRGRLGDCQAPAFENGEASPSVVATDGTAGGVPKAPPAHKGGDHG